MPEWGSWGFARPETGQESSVATEENWEERARVLQQRLDAVLELTRSASRRGEITREQLRQVEDAAGVERPAPTTLTITLQVEGDVSRVPLDRAGDQVEGALSRLAEAQGLTVVSGSTRVNTGGN